MSGAKTGDDFPWHWERKTMASFQLFPFVVIDTLRAWMPFDVSCRHAKISQNLFPHWQNLRTPLSSFARCIESYDTKSVPLYMYLTYMYQGSWCAEEDAKHGRAAIQSSPVHVHTVHTCILPTRHEWKKELWKSRDTFPASCPCQTLPHPIPLASQPDRIFWPMGHIDAWLRITASHWLHDDPSWNENPVIVWDGSHDAISHPQQESSPRRCFQTVGSKRDVGVDRETWGDAKLDWSSYFNSSFSTWWVLDSTHWMIVIYKIHCHTQICIESKYV